MQRRVAHNIERIFFIFAAIAATLAPSNANNQKKTKTQKTTTFNLFASRNYVRDEIENRNASQKSLEQRMR